MDEYLEVEIEGHRLAALMTYCGNPDIPVFFLHGITGSIYFWPSELTAPFHGLGSCYSLSLPGHFPADCLTPELISHLLAGAIQKLVGNRKALLVGHSKGQWSGALGFSQWLVRQGSLGRAIYKKIYQIGGLSETVFRMYWHVYVNDHTFLLKHPCTKAFINSTFPYFKKLDLGAMIHYFSVMPGTDITPWLSQITVPTCLIVGNKDPIVPPKQSRLIAEKIINARLVVIRGAGHLTFFERPLDYERAIDSWLTEFHPCNGTSIQVTPASS